MTCEVTFNSDEQPENVYRKFYKDVVFVPEKVCYNGKEYKVTAIGEDAFSRSDELLSVVLPSTIVYIGLDAFACCPKFKSLTIPENVRDIHLLAFNSMPSLEYLAVDENNKFFDSREGCNAIIKTQSNTLYVGCSTTVIPEGVKVIADGAFMTGFGFWDGLGKPFELVLPKSVEVIERQAFAGCHSLKKITFSEGLKSIGHWAFNGTSIECAVIPASVTEISDGAFVGCDSLKVIKVKRGNKVYDSRKGCNAVIESDRDRMVAACVTTSIPEGVKIIGENAFSRCLIEEVAFPSSLELIERGAFSSCRNLKHVRIPGNVKEIGYDVFWGSGVESVNVEEGVEKIGGSAFRHCKKLKKVSLPASLKEISGGRLFEGCRELERVSLDRNNDVYYCNGAVLLEKETRTVVDGWGIDKCYVGNGYVHLKAKKIGEYAFSSHELLGSVVLPETLEEIGTHAFYDCKGLRVVECWSAVPPVLGKDAFRLNMPSNGYMLPLQERTVIVVPKGSLEAYRNAAGWNEFKHIREMN